MAEPVRVRRLTDQEGQRLQQIVRRGSTSSVRYRRAMMLLASAGGNRVPVIAQLVRADEDTVRDVIHRFNEIGLACLNPRWAGGRPRLLSPDDEDFVVQTATTRPTKLGQPFTRWSLRKLAAYLRRVHGRVIRIGREALRCLLVRRGVTFQRTKTWKESPDPARDTKLDRIEHVLEHFPNRVFAFDEFGPLGIRPTRGSCWAAQGRPERHPATYHRTHGVRYFHGCYSVGDDTLWGVNRRKKGASNTLAALRSIRAARPDGAPIYVILDNVSAHKGEMIRQWAIKNRVELCFTPTYASWANPIEAHFGPLRQFTVANSNTPTTPSRHASCTATCAGATPTPAIATSSPPNARNAPASAARKAFGGAAAHSSTQPDPKPVNLCGQGTSGGEGCDNGFDGRVQQGEVPTLGLPGRQVRHPRDRPWA
ncbi:IS630 family transposase [Streptomyces xanthochromogenes]|nr:IS630 family transposase [Streptomyces xanthochromogenes]